MVPALHLSRVVALCRVPGARPVQAPAHKRTVPPRHQIQVLGDPIVDGTGSRRVLATMPPAATRSPCRMPFLTFTPEGLVAVARDYWFLEPGTHPPYEGWGH